MLRLHHIKAIIYDFDGTLAVLNIDFSLMKEEVFDLLGRYGIEEKAVQEKYRLRSSTRSIKYCGRRVLPLLTHFIRSPTISFTKWK